MKYEKCLKCDQLGKTCDGPNLLAMETVELGLWCDELRKQHPGMTYDRIATDNDISKTAVYNFLKGAHEDCSLHTARTVAKHIMGDNWDNNPCGNVSNSEKAAYEEKIRQLNDENQQLKTSVVWHEDKIQDLKEKNASLETLVVNTNARMTQDKDFLRGQIKSKNRAIVILSISLAVVLLLVIAALIVDRIDPSIGFFWLEGLFHPQSVKDGVNLIGKGI